MRKVKHSRRLQNVAEDSTRLAIQSANKDERRFRPVMRGGQHVPGVYERAGVIYAYVRDPESGRRRWVRAPGQSIADAEAIVKKSAKLRDQADREAWRAALESTRRRSAFSPIGRVVESYLDAAAERRAVTGRDPAEATARGCYNVVKRALAAGLDEPCDRAPDVLREYVVREADRLEQSTMHTVVTRCQQVFCSWACDFYEKRGLVVPRSMRWPEVRRARYKYVAPPAELRQATIEAGKAEVEKRSAIGAAFLACYFAAMACRDAARARWDWLGADGHVRFERHKTGKPCDPPLSQWALAQWRAWAAEAKEPLLLQGFPSEYARINFLHREVSSWMRSLGWPAGDGAHELRKLAASLWMSSCGLAYASRWIGDSQPICAKYYADCLPELAPTVPES